jgi:serine/threonine protein kinase
MWSDLLMLIHGYDIFEEPGSSSGLAGSGVGGATSVIRRLQPGSLLGNYEILETIGQGGMGTVLKARHLRMDRLVALKVLRTQSTKPAGAIQRFQQEVRAASRLTHPNIVTAHDADEVNGIHFLVMECVDGVDLDELLAERKRLPYKEAVEYVVQVANGLAYAHREGVVHRDIKPGNLMLDQRNTIKIMDMGLASIIETTTEQARQQESAQVTQADQILGTFDYMAPEQGEDARSADHRADIYSLGCTLFKLVTGKAPYSGATTIQKIFAHREHPIPTMSKLCAEVPFDLDAVFGKMVAKDPGMRYQSMEEVVTELQACLKSEPISAWQTGKWGQSESDGGQSLVHDETLRIEPSSSDNDPDEYTLSPVADEQVLEKRKQRQESDTKKAEAERTKETQPRWFWRVMGEEIGPFTLAKLKQENINTLDELRREDSDQWVVAQDVEGLFD